MGPLAFPGNGEERQRGNKLRGREEMVNQRENGFIEIGTGIRIGSYGEGVRGREEEEEEKEEF